MLVEPNFHFDSLNTDYFAPFRIEPKRNGYWLDESLDFRKLGIKGEKAYQLLIKSSLTTEKTLLNKVDSFYKKEFGGWGVKVNEDNADMYGYGIELYRDDFKDVGINLKDSGQGINQTLPLVIRAFEKVQENTLIIIEQPELHLHPAAHGGLAQLFAESIKEDFNKRYLIETHSQNFILRLRRLVAEKSIQEQDIIIYYIEYDENGNESNLKEIEIDSDGVTSFWPVGIFSESIDEISAIRTAQQKLK